MFQVSCAACNASFEYNVDDYIHLCPFCSSGFILDLEEGAKDIIGDHFIVPNRMDREQVESIFYEWITSRYHRPDKVKSEFQILGSYGISLPYWVISVEAHTFWSGHSQKANHYRGQGSEYGARFLKEENRFSRRYRWSVLARKSPKEHWGLERLHHPKEDVLVDWDGYPLDETLGIVKGAGSASVYDARQTFKFDHANGLTISGVQVKESSAITRAKDQIQEYHRRIAKTKVGTLYEHRTEIEIVGIHLVHLPFWVVRYSFAPKSMFRFMTTARERRLLVQGHSLAVLEAELPLSSADKVMTNLMVCGSLAVVSLGLALFVHPLFFLVTMVFTAVCVLSAWKIFGREKTDSDLGRGADLQEPAT
jgi:hypothetical protein